jgi:hypothetical protein
MSKKRGFIEKWFYWFRLDELPIEYKWAFKNELREVIKEQLLLFKKWCDDTSQEEKDVDVFLELMGHEDDN